MKKLSFWAKNHKWQSWFIITFSYLLLIYLAVFLANVAFVAGLSLNLYSIFAIIGIAVLLFEFYPLKNTQFYTYKNRKRADLALVTTGFLLVFSLFNTMITEYEPASTTTNPYARQTILKSSASSFENDSKFTKVRKRIKRKSYQRTQQFKKIWQDRSQAVQVLLIFSTILLTLVLGYLIAILACSLSCSGSGIAALIVLILGWSGIIVGAILLIRRIIKKGKNKDKDTSKAI